MFAKNTDYDAYAQGKSSLSVKNDQTILPRKRQSLNFAEPMSFTRTAPANLRVCIPSVDVKINAGSLFESRHNVPCSVTDKLAFVEPHKPPSHNRTTVYRGFIVNKMAILEL